MKSLMFFMISVVTFLTFSIFLVSGLTSGYVLALSENGGGFHVRNNSIFTVGDGTTISKNTATNGGGVYVGEGGTLNIGEALQVNDYVYFGSYPKTYQSDTSVITSTQDSNGYYLGTDGERYAKVSANPYNSSYVFNDGTTIVSETEYYFKVEPIKWRILKTENGKALLFCEDIIDALWFDDETSNNNNYSESEIRAYLNGYSTTYGSSYFGNGFLQKAFTTSEQNSILTTEVDNGASTTDSLSNPYTCENTNDKIFLMSYQDMINTEYGFSSSVSTYDTAKRKKTTDYARANYAWNNTSSSCLFNGPYWLRSPFRNNSVIAYRVSSEGIIYSNGTAEFSTVGVVPALYVSESKIQNTSISISGNTATSGKGNDIYNAGTFTMNGGSIGISSVNRYDENGNPDENGEYTFFGLYPKTYQSDTSVITSTQDSNGYYLGTDGGRYAKVSANPSNSSYVFNNGKTIVSGTEYYFKVEPIKWRILKTENGKALLFCEDIIDAHKFNYKSSDRTINGSTIYANNYKYSDIRAWLNGYGQESGNTSGENWLGTGFLQKAFTTSEQNSILTTEVDNSASTTDSSSNSYACENTNDKIFLLSYKDMINPEYGFNSSSSNSDTARRKQTTDYARANYANYNTNSGYLYNGYYWLRSPSSSNYIYASYVRSDGYSSKYSYVGGSDGGIAPAMWVSESVLEKDEVVSGYGIYNTGEMNLYGGTIYDNIYSETSFNVSMNVDIQGTITLGDSAIINVVDYVGVTPNYHIIVSSSRTNNMIMTLKGSSITPDLSNFKGVDTNTYEIKVEQGSSSTEWKIILAEKDVELPTEWKNEISSTDYMTTIVNDLYYLTSIKFEFSVPSGYTQIGTLSTGLRVYQDSSDSTAIAFVNGKTIFASNKPSFSGLGYIRTLNFENFNTSKAIDMSYMFSNCYSLSDLDLSGFDTSNVTNMSGMFSGIFSSSKLDLSSFDTSNVTNMRGMFNGHNGLCSVNLSSFDTSNVTDMSYMFSGCYSLSDLDLSGFDTSKVTDMSHMFYECSYNLSSLNLSSFNTSNVSDMESMFYNCSSLVTLDLSSFDMKNVTKSTNMLDFGSSAVLQYLKTPYNNFSYIEITNGNKLYNISTGVIAYGVDSYTSESLTLSIAWTVHFDPCGGSCDKEDIVVVDRCQIGKLPTPTRDGYDFVGWFTESDGGTQISETTTITSDVSFYARWSEVLNSYTRVDENGNVDPDGDYILFGSYPKTYQSDTSVITSTQDENGYYLGTDGNRYVKVSATPYQSTYQFSDETIIVLGTEYYFKVEPIKWRILKKENGKALLFCEEIIDAHHFYSSTSSRTINGSTIYANNYKYSDIRAWLNGYGQESGNTSGENWLGTGFLQTAFTTAEQNSILITEVDNSASTTDSSSNSYACENTNDKIFLLSYQDMINTEYGFDSSYSNYDTARRKQTTDYARANYAHSETITDQFNNGIYRLRSPRSSGFNHVCLVFQNGVSSAGSIHELYFGVVPALYILFEFKTWTVHFDPCGGSCDKEDIVVVDGCQIGELPTPTRDGYDFVGWFTESDGGTQISETTTITSDVSFYARWSEVLNSYTRVDENGNVDPDGDYVLFGSYPKTYQSDTSVITSTKDENGYYLGTDGNRYAKVSANPFSSSYTFNDGTTIVSGTEYYFKVEPIKWRILKTENGKALLFCEDIINAMWFDEAKLGYNNNYANSEIRAYLNGYSTTYDSSYFNNGFLQKAFTTAEQNSILITEVDNSASTTNSTSNAYACENTNDKVFLLSYQDMINTEYGFSSVALYSDVSRQKQTTDYARANYAWYSTSSDYLYNGYYWLRSPYSSYDYSACDIDFCSQCMFNHVTINYMGVVPALWLDLGG